jgi:hypothetical protein
MGITDDLSELMVDDATWYPFASRDGYGKRTFGTGVAYKGRLYRKARMVRDFQGHEVLSSHHFWFCGTPDVGPQDKITLANNTSPVLASVERPSDEDGPAYTKVFFL